MKILFLGRHFTYFRNFESVLRELAARGHTIHVAAERDEAFGGQQLVESLAASTPGITCGRAPIRAADARWGWVAGWLRLGLDFVRYQHQVFDDAPRLRTRALERTPGLFIDLSRLPVGRQWLRRAQSAALRRLERALPLDPTVQSYLADQRPDVLLITPLIELGSSQIDYLRAARTMGIPTALCVWSWDHLSSKALIRECPDRVFLWNETQKREAVELHGVPDRLIVVTGAQCFDQWFDREPSRDRETFCRQIGLPADRPILLYVCSALFAGSPVEAEFVVEWIRRIRASDQAGVRDAGILVRPHPSRLPEWDRVSLDGLGPVALWGSNPITTQSRADYFDSLAHASVVVGLNTSAFIEAAIVGRPVLTLLLPEFFENQMGTLHFRYLRTVGGGLLTVADTFDEHLQQMGCALQAPASGSAAFVREFVRPLGLERPATTAFADAVDAMQSLVPEPPATDPWAPHLRRMLEGIDRAYRGGRFERWLLSPRERVSVQQARAAAATKEERRQALAREREEQRARVRAERESRRVANDQARLARRQADEARKAARLAERLERKRRHREQKRAGKRAQKPEAQSSTP